MKPAEDNTPGEKTAGTTLQNHLISDNRSCEKKWYAVYTRSRHEKKALNNLLERGFDAWLPMYRTIRQWSDRKKMIEKPLLNSYVFVRITSRDFYNVQGTDGICTIIKCQGQPVPIPQCQIDNLKLIIDSRAEVEVTGEKFEKGDEVIVTIGTLKGLRGELISHGNRKKLLVRIDSIEKNITVTVPVSYLRKL
ncbi:MAG: UpxY family transcription antiterminator [Bacteroidales bacterium]|jgi:transcription antitermination factor NusG|nr:UpxY family transcription antiterminator [Bacteroidales bacterium]